MMKRLASAAGSFYPAEPEKLKATIEALLGPVGSFKINRRASGKIKGLLCPHAGYMYSGKIAACSFLNLAADHSPNHILLIGPNHTGYGDPVSLYPEGQWQTPLGTIEVDNSWVGPELAKIAAVDESAHRFEHSIEVQLPFLQFLYGKYFKISAIALMDQSLETMLRIAEAMQTGRFPFIVGTSDMSHNVSAQTAKENDLSLAGAFEELEPEKMFSLIRQNKITACGPGVLAILAYTAKINGWKASVLCYGNSGDVTGDDSSVVGYLGANIREE